MPYLVDTDWVIDYLADDEPALKLLEQLAEGRIASSTITYMVICQGVERAPDPRAAEAKLAAFLESVPIIPLSTAVARRCARLREALRQAGRRVNSRALDLIIAATALEHGLTLVTRNVHGYRDIPGLQLYTST